MNPYGGSPPRDFKSLASASSATPAWLILKDFSDFRQQRNNLSVADCNWHREKSCLLWFLSVSPVTVSRWESGKEKVGSVSIFRV